MEREIRPGDFVETPSQDFTIESIDEEQIILISTTDPETKAVLRWSPEQQKWLLNGQDIPFKFRPRTILTQVPDVDIKILNYLDDRSLSNACLTDRYILSLCRSDALWLDRIERFFLGGGKLRQGDISLREHYFNLRKIFAAPFPADKAIELNYTLSDLFEWLKTQRLVPSFEGLNKWAKQGNLDLIRWAFRHGIIPGYGVISGAASKGHLHIIDWMEKENIFPDIRFTLYARGELTTRLVVLKRFLESIAATAMVDSFEDIVEWFNKRGFRPDKNIIAHFAAEKGDLDLLKTLPLTNINSLMNSAAEGGQIHVLEYLRGYERFTVSTANAAAKEGHTETVKWLSQWVLPDWGGLSATAAQGNLDIIKHVIKEPTFTARLLLGQSKLNVIKYLLEIGVKPENDITHIAAKNGLETTQYFLSLGYKLSDGYTSIATEHGHLDALQWAVEQGFPLPNYESINIATIKGYVDILKWLPIKPSYGSILKAIENNQGDVVRWAINSGIYQPDVEGANIAADHGYIAILELLGVLPDKEGIIRAIKGESVRTLVWLEVKGITPETEWANLALDNNSFIVLEWLVSHGIYPSKEEISRSVGLARLWLDFEGFIQ